MNTYLDSLILFARLIEANAYEPKVPFSVEELAGVLELETDATRYLIEKAVYAGVFTRSIEADTGKELYNFDPSFTNWFIQQRSHTTIVTHHGLPVTFDAALLLARTEIEGDCFLALANDRLCKANRVAMEAQLDSVFTIEASNINTTESDTVVS